MADIILITQRHDYISEVVTSCKDKFVHGILDVYMIAKAKNELRKYFLRDFQLELSNIAEWNEDKLRVEQARFIEHDKMKMYIQSIYETNSIIYEGEHKVVRNEADVVREFVKQTYLQIARELWKKPNIMQDIVEKRQVSKNMEYLEKIIVQAIKATLRRGHRHVDMKTVHIPILVDVDTHDVQPNVQPNVDSESNHDDQDPHVDDDSYDDDEKNDDNIDVRQVTVGNAIEQDNEQKVGTEEENTNLDVLLFNQKSLSRAASLDLKPSRTPSTASRTSSHATSSSASSRKSSRAASRIASRKSSRIASPMSPRTASREASREASRAASRAASREASRTISRTTSQSSRTSSGSSNSSKVRFINNVSSKVKSLKAKKKLVNIPTASMVSMGKYDKYYLHKGRPIIRKIK